MPVNKQKRIKQSLSLRDKNLRFSRSKESKSKSLFTPPVPHRSLNKNIFSVRAEIHCHSNADLTRLSYAPFLYGSVQSVEDIIKRCLDNNIKILSITDHNSLSGYYRAKEIIEQDNLDIILVPGTEIESKDGDILAYGVEKPIPKYLSVKKTVAEIHKQGGFAIAAHPYIFFSLRDKVYNFSFDAIEVYNPQLPKLFIRKAAESAYKLSLPATAGSDAHLVEELGKGSMYFSKDIKTAKDVITAIKNKHFYISLKRTSYLSMPMRLLFRNITLHIKLRNEKKEISKKKESGVA